MSTKTVKRQGGKGGRSTAPSLAPSPSIRNRNLGVRRVRACDLVAHPMNWRQHPQAQQDALRGLLNEVGFVGTLLAYELPDGRLQLIDGHLRQETMPAEEVDVMVVDLSPEEAAKVLATHDPLAAMAEANAGQLDALLREVQTGDEALAAMLDGLGGGEVVEDEAPEPPKEAVSRTGDLWILGEHRLLCGDSTKAEDVARVMGGERAALCFTSPPYAQQRDYTAESRAHTSDWDGLMRGVFGNLPMADDGQVLVNLGLVHREGEWWPYWDGWIDWMRSQGWRRFGWYVWDQGSGLPGDWSGRFAPSHEFIFHFNRESQRPEKILPTKGGTCGTTFRAKDGSRKRFTTPGAKIQPTKIPDSVVRLGRQVGSDGHPAQFPVALSAGIMQAWPGLAYEPFSGSGTTIIAAEQLGRRCFAIEIAPIYVDVAVARWEKLTGRETILESTGRTFAETGRERCVL